jgi:hypothetical protein
MLPCLSLDDVLPQLQCYKVPEETSEKFLRGTPWHFGVMLSARLTN